MEEALKAIKDTPVPTILVVAGLLFVLLAFAGGFSGRIQVPLPRQKWVGIVGALVLMIGIALYVVPVRPSPGEPTPTPYTPEPPPTDTPTPTSTYTPVPTPTDTPTPTSTYTPVPTPTDTPTPTSTYTPVPTPTDTPTPHPSLFPDSGLADAVREQLGIQSSERIAVEDLAAITLLNAEGRGIVDLEGIQHLRNLRFLVLRQNEIEDLSPIQSLDALVHLDLSRNKITDISPLKSLNRLAVLELEENNITDISPLIDNPGIADGDRLSVWANKLELMREESTALADVKELESRGVDVIHDHAFLYKWGAEGSDEESFEYPRSVAVVGQIVFVAQPENGNVQLFEFTGTTPIHRYLGSWTQDGTKPWAIAADANGLLFVVDKYNHNVHVVEYDSSRGSYGAICKWGMDSRDQGPGEFDSPEGIALLREGRVLVADTGNNRIQVLRVDKDAADCGYVAEFGSEGGLYGPRAVATDQNGRAYVVDRNDRVVVFELQDAQDSYSYVSEWGSSGKGDGQFDKPTGIGVARDGRLYVADTNNHRIQVLDLEGNPVDVWANEDGPTSKKPGEFNWPWGIATDVQGNVYVVEASNHRIQVFNQATQRAVFLVNTTDDDPNPGPCDLSHCTLREAITQANQGASEAMVVFDIPGKDPYTVRPQIPLPPIQRPLTVDGSSHPSFRDSPIVELDGSEAGENAFGLKIVSGGSRSTIRDLAINRFRGDGIRIEGASDNILEGNYIGTDIEGTQDLGNGGYGIAVDKGSRNRIGGTEARQANVVSGNDGNGILIYSGAEDNLVQGNFVGTSADGTLHLGNGGSGVVIDSASNNLIGGVAAGAGNVISANGADGVTIAVTISGGTAIGNQIRRNNISLNKGVGIRLLTKYGTRPNALQPAPKLIRIEVDPSGWLEVHYSVDSSLEESRYPLIVEFYLSDDQQQEGRVFVGSHVCSASDAKSEAVALLRNMSSPGMTATDMIVATATDVLGNTSQFSNGLETVRSD